MQPSFSVEFVAYYQDRDERIQDLRKRLSDKLKEDEQLRERETRTRPNFDLMTRRCESAKETNEDLRKKVSTFRDILVKLKPDKKLPECQALRPLFRPLDIVTPNVKARATLWGSSTAGPSSVSPKSAAKRLKSDFSTLSLKNCQLCKKTKDQVVILFIKMFSSTMFHVGFFLQHLLAHCDTCRLYYHLGCLTPPLTRMPRKSKLYGWQCSECDKSSGDEEVEDPSAPRKKRQAAARALAASR